MMIKFRYLLLVLVFLGGGGANAQVPKAKQPMTAELRTFSKANPRCAGWTDWRQFCSRTGPNGEDYCLTDPAVPVKPSAVFCAAWELMPKPELEALQAKVTTAQRRSQWRFSGEKFPPIGLSPDNRKIEGLFDLRVAGGVGKRPFASKNYVSRHHPWCKAWTVVVLDEPVPTACMKYGHYKQSESCGDKTNPRYEYLCLKDSKQHSKICQREVGLSFSTKGHFIGCGEWNVPAWCEIASSMQNKSKYPPEGEINFGIEFFPANGMVCLKRASPSSDQPQQQPK
jgi:hypothetical protein